MRFGTQAAVRGRAPVRRLGSRSARGQSLLEFALIFPIVLILIIGMIEFAFAFNAILSVNFASRDAALLAAEAASSAGSDCVILAKIEDDVSVPAKAKQIQQVRIFWTDSNGTEKAANVYSRTASTTCTFPDGSTITVPYTATSVGYPVSARCGVIAGCGGSHPGLDTIGVAIHYHHNWITGIPAVFSWAAIDFTRSNAMRMEPIL
ncbi:MAG: pilus assembly protein [Chloroflexota bacterium]|nr:pilus assembly protein [Chloroflexota bacterium]